ncbi:hypothetical protein [Nocardia sp. NPDC046763]|uniref:hypothetical protein n=1 Tax=Nocardia sp. NPDC046763 TaxID=3155256 RepID=UPI0033FE901B
MTTFDVRPAGPAADLSAARFAALTSEVDRLREALAAKNREMATMGRLVEGLLDRESMHVYDADMERLTTASAIDRHGAPRAQHGHPKPQHTLPAPARPDAFDMEVTGAWSVPEWSGFDR